MHREGFTNVFCDLHINYSLLTNTFQCTHKCVHYADVRSGESQISTHKYSPVHTQMQTSSQMKSVLLIQLLHLYIPISICVCIEMYL